MVTRKRKKNSRQRGSNTHGWGAMKKHRGKGNKGGAGMAGTGKRGDAKKPSIWKSEYFGKKGFKKKGLKRETKAINIDELEMKLDRLISQGKVQKEGDTFIVDLDNLGFNRLLGKGRLTKKLRITVEHASERAVAKIQEKNGEVFKKEEAK